MTGNKKRIYEPLTEDDLKELKKLGLGEHEEFFRRNLRLEKAYHNSLIGIVLCQGGASHYLNRKAGINDFDIWHFYVEDENIKFPYRAHKRIENGYKGRPVDFLKRAIPKRICQLYSNDPGEVIIKYLRERNTKTKIFLLKKPGIGLFPDNIFGKVLWEGEL